MSFVDEGGHFTQERARSAAGNARGRKKVFCIKGYAGPDRISLLSHRAAQAGEDRGQRQPLRWAPAGSTSSASMPERKSSWTICAYGTAGPKYCHFPEAGRLRQRLFQRACCRKRRSCDPNKDKRQPWSVGRRFPDTSETRRWTAATTRWRRSRRCRATLDEHRPGTDQGRSAACAVAAPARGWTVPHARSAAAEAQHSGHAKYYDEW